MDDNQPPTDEYGDVSVFSDERLAALKVKADKCYAQMTLIIKNSETAIDGFKTWVEAAVKNEHAFFEASKAYLAELEKIKDESYKPKF